ncbi:MAG: leucine-rich repeat protein [Ruminococcus sp.]|nr:leucine-rich repeat protein [Ruminococcus sp.]
MNLYELFPSKEFKKLKEDKTYVTENLINSLHINMPSTFGDYAVSELNFELRVYLPTVNSNGTTDYSDYIGYPLTIADRAADVPITNDITGAVQIVKIMILAYKDGNVIGKTNFVDKQIYDAPLKGEPLTPRKDFDEVIRQQRETIESQGETITEQQGTITEQGEQITELSGEVSELTTENTNLSNQNETYRQTIQTFIDNPPVPKLETPEIVTPSGIVQQITPDTEEDYVGLTSVTVNRVTAEGVGFSPDYYKEGEMCLGEVGTYNPFPYNSVGGIYITEVDDEGYPVEFLVKDWEKAPETFPQFFDISASAVRSLKTIIFENCPSIKYFPQACFHQLRYLKNIILPENLTAISQYCFQDPCGIEKIVFSRSVLEIVQRAFQQNRNLISVQLNSGIQSISSYAFLYCGNLETINLPNSLTGIAGDAFFSCTRLENVTIENGFNCDNLNLSFSTRYTAETIISWLNALADRTGQTAYTLTIGATNLAKMTAEEIAIVTNKNWNLA